MTNDSRSVHEIEREIERDRAQLTSNLEHLQNKFSVDGIVQQLGDQLREHGGEIGNAITRTVKENPAAVVLTGVGLAWMIFGQGRSGASRGDAGRDSSWEDRRAGGSYGGHASSATLVTRPDPRMKGGTEGVPAWAHDDDDDGSSLADRAAGAAASAQSKASAAGSALHGKAAAAGSAVKDAGAAAMDKAAAAGQSVRDGASSAAETARLRAARLRARLAEGTENLSEEAKARVIAAREAAIDARRKAAEALASGSRQSADFYNRQPLVAGALALALGAAIGGALPRTRTEDDMLGAYSDKMMERAEAILREEQEKAVAVMQAARQEAETIVSEKREAMDSAAPEGKTAAQAAADEVKSAGKRIAGAAADKAKEKDLGKPTS